MCLAKIELKNDVPDYTNGWVSRTKIFVIEQGKLFTTIGKWRDTPIPTNQIIQAEQIKSGPSVEQQYINGFHVFTNEQTPKKLTGTWNTSDGKNIKFVARSVKMRGLLAKGNLGEFNGLDTTVEVYQEMIVEE